MKTIWNIVMKPTIILCALILFQVSHLIYLLTTEPRLLDEYVMLRALLVLIVVAIAIAALFEKKLALWIMGIYLLSFIIGIIIGLFKISPQHYWVKAIMIVMGTYFTIGGWMLVQRARKNTEMPNQALFVPSKARSEGRE